MLKSFFISALLCSVAFPGVAIAQASSDDQSVVTYKKEYFIKYDPITLLDMLQRVPGVQAILDANRRQGGGGGTGQGGQQERGFGSAGDQILINNKRLSGKANNISDSLARISETTVERVEIIRGASSDLDVQSQGLVINVIMAGGASTSSTFWKVGGRYSETYVISPDLQVSHNDSRGKFDYIIGAQVRQGQHIEHRFDQSYSPDDVFFADSQRRTDNIFKTLKFNGNLTYNAENGGEFHLNGQFEPGKYTKREPRFSRDLNQPKNLQNWDEDQKSQKWEIGGDYTKNIDGLGSWKTLFIANRDRIDKLSRFENTPASGIVPIFQNDQFRVKQEKILRTSLTKDITSNQIVEVGVETAINNYDQIFTQETYDSGDYNFNTNDDVAVKENRYELFANHTYNVSSKIVIQSTLTGEFSKISSLTVPLNGANIERSKKFSFLKPRIDLRYDFSVHDQIRATVEKKISQLDFQNFVAKYDVSLDRIKLGNTGIVPEKSWNYSLTYEHRLPNDAGAAQIEFFYRDISDYIDLVDFTEFFDGNGAAIPRENLDFTFVSGNIPNATSYGLKTSGSLRLGFIGLPEALFSVDYKWEKTNVTDQFSGVERSFKWMPEHEVNFNFRHDITKWNMSYGVKGTIQGNSDSHEIDLIDRSSNGDLYEVFAEFKIFGDLKLIFIFEHLTPYAYDVVSEFYKDHIRYNDLDHYQNRQWKFVREYTVYLQGTF